MQLAATSNRNHKDNNHLSSSKLIAQTVQLIGHRKALETRVIRLNRRAEDKSFGVHVQYDPQTGHVISQIIPNTPASKSSLKVNDVIVQLDDEVILHLSYESIRLKLANFQNESVLLHVINKRSLVNSAQSRYPILTSAYLKSSSSSKPFVATFDPKAIKTVHLAAECDPSIFDDTNHRTSNHHHHSPNHHQQSGDIKYVSTFRAELSSPVRKAAANDDQDKIGGDDNDNDDDRDKSDHQMIETSEKFKTDPNDYVQRQLGIHLNFITSKMTSQSGQRIKESLVENITAGSIAELAGFAIGDRIERLNGVSVCRMNLAEFHEAVEVAFERNNQLLFSVQRGPDEIRQIKTVKRAEPIASTDPMVRTITIKDGRNALLGFDLKTITIENETGSEMLHALGSVVEGLPGHLAGMRDGDRIVSINGTGVDNISHASVLSLIKRNLDNLVISVITDKVVLNAIMADEINRCFSRPSDEADVYRVVIEQNPETKSIGISLTGDLCVFSVDKGSDAERAGIRTGDLLKSVNSVGVSPQNPMEAFDVLRRAVNAGPVGLELKRSEPVPSLPCCRKCRVDCDGMARPIGLSLKERPGLSFHEVASVSADGCAQKAGIRPGDLIVSIGGESAHRKSFEIVRSMLESQRKMGGSFEVEVVDSDVYAEIQNHDDDDETDQIVLRKQTGGFVIDSIEVNCRAMKAGLRKNDLILSVNGIQLAFYDLRRANEFANCALKGDSAEIVISAGGDEAVCLIRNGVSSWRLREFAGKICGNSRYASEPDVRPSKLTAKEAESLNGGSSGRNNNKYTKIISSIKRFCSKERGSKRPSVIEKRWAKQDQNRLSGFA